MIVGIAVALLPPPPAVAVPQTDQVEVPVVVLSPPAVPRIGRVEVATVFPPQAPGTS